MSYSARLVTGRTTYCTLCCHRCPPCRNDTSSDNEHTHCSCLSIRLSRLIVHFLHACCIKTHTDYSFHVCSLTVVGLRYVMPINKRIFDWFDLTSYYPSVSNPYWHVHLCFASVWHWTIVKLTWSVGDHGHPPWGHRALIDMSERRRWHTSRNYGRLESDSSSYW